MAINTKILKLKSHSLNIDMLWAKNSETPSASSDVTQDTISKVSEVVGDLFPLIDINNFKFNHYDILYMELCEVDFIPSIKISVVDTTGAFTNKFYPKNRSLMKVYIKSSNDKVKPVRNDFIISNIVASSNSSTSLLSAEGKGFVYYITGTLNVPSLYENVTFSYKNTSFDALYTIADKLKLGFSSNELNTNDNMTWIQCNISYKDMIDDIVAHSYKDSSSFYTAHIDRYYNLTLVNLYDMLSQEQDFDAMFNNLIKNKSSYSISQKKESDEIDDVQDNVLSNYSGFKGMSNFIKSFSPNSKQGLILKHNPNRKYINYYDSELQEFVNFFIEPFGNIISDEEIGKNTGYVDECIDYDNTHNNYFFAKHSNVQNILDLKKIEHVIELSGANFNLLKGMRVPLLMIKEGTQMITEDINVETEENMLTPDDKDNIKFDSDNSGYYIIDWIKYIYNPTSQDTAFSTFVGLNKTNHGLNLVENNN